MTPALHSAEAKVQVQGPVDKSASATSRYTCTAPLLQTAPLVWGGVWRVVAPGVAASINALP